MKKNQTPPTVSVNGQDVPVFGSLDSKSLAIVDLDVLQRIIMRMSFTDLDTVKEEFIERVKSSYDLKEYIRTMERELRFHKTVNDIDEYRPDEDYMGIPMMTKSH